MAFLIIFGVGLLLTVVTFVIGELFDFGDGSADASGEVGDPSPSPFSSRILFIFLTSFGGFGFIGASLDWSVWASSLFGIAGGVVVAAGMFFIVVAPMARNQGSTTVSEDDYLHREGQVTAEIPEGGLGRVTFVALASGARVSPAARSANGQRIPFGTAVKVVAIGAGAVTVVPLVPTEIAPGTPWPERTNS